MPEFWDYPCVPIITMCDDFVVRALANSWADDREDMSQGKKLLYISHLLLGVTICIKYVKDHISGSKVTAQFIVLVFDKFKNRYTWRYRSMVTCCYTWHTYSQWVHIYTKYEKDLAKKVKWLHGQCFVDQYGNAMSRWSRRYGSRWNVIIYDNPPPPPPPPPKWWIFVLQITRCSENNNTPQPPDQWMNSLFKGQQVGNCMSCTSTHYLANVLAMHCGPRASEPIVHPTLYPTHISFIHPTHISFIPSQSNFPFLKYGYQKFDLENQRSRSWMRSKFKVITWVQHPLDSHPFGSMSIHPLIPTIDLFLNLTFKIQGQSHSSRSHSRYNILLTHIPFFPCWLALKFLRYSYFKNWPWKPRSRSWVRSSKFKVTMWV